MPNGDTIEECMSLAGLCNKWKKENQYQLNF